MRKRVNIWTPAPPVPIGIREAQGTWRSPLWRRVLPTAAIWAHLPKHSPQRTHLPIRTHEPSHTQILSHTSSAQWTKAQQPCIFRLASAVATNFSRTADRDPQPDSASPSLRVSYAFHMNLCSRCCCTYSAATQIPRYRIDRFAFCDRSELYTYTALICASGARRR